jgi:mannosyl-oligosaccharide alpha-1,2-mannosidase
VDVLKFAFNTPTGIPVNNLNIVGMTTDGSTTNGLATTGTLVLEWTHLSDLLNSTEYANLAQKAESYLLNPQPSSDEPWPGLLGTDISVIDGSFVDNFGSWGASSDSFYEYLIKMYVYDSSRFAHYKDRWVKAADSTIAYIASHPSSRTDLTFLAAWDGNTLSPNSQHLACFAGGNFLLGGNALGEQKYIDFGLALVNGCHDTYTSTLTGIGPETFAWSTTGTNGVPANDQAFYKKAGFYITSSGYILRPEVLEGIYYAYRVTGDTKYQDWAWDAFNAINSTCRAGSGFAGLSDVNAVGGGTKQDFQESFLFAETMKYSYLIHAIVSFYLLLCLLNILRMTLICICDYRREIGMLLEGGRRTTGCLIPRHIR